MRSRSRRDRAHRGALLAGAGALLATGLVGGCSRDDEAPPPRIDASASDSASAQSSPSPSAPSSSAAAVPSRPPVYGQKLPDTADVTAGSIPTDGVEAVVAQSLVSYMRVRLGAYHEARVDLDALARVASGPALEEVQSYVAGLQQRGQHTDGRLEVDIGGVELTGDSATVRSCMRNSTADVNKQDQVIERTVSPAYRVRATAQRVSAGAWVVSRISFRFVGSCG